MKLNQVALLALIGDFLMARGTLIPDEQLIEYNFFESGALDSFEILSLIMEIEAQYSIQVPPELMLESSNGRVGTLIESLLALPSQV